MMLNIKVVIVSKDQSHMMTNDDFPINDFAHFKVVYVFDNNLPLSKIYNAEIERDTYDLIALRHSDVKFNFVEFAQKLTNIKDKYDVIGLCGCSKLVASQTPLNWFCGSRPCPEHRWGCVTHGEIGNQTTFFNSHSPNISDHEVACIDGLFIMLSKKAVDSGLRFDESVGKYDFYDTDISFQAVINYKLKIGVIIQKDLQHYSLGKSILSEDFLVNEYIFRSKWKLPIPENCKTAYDKRSSN